MNLSEIKASVLKLSKKYTIGGLVVLVVAVVAIVHFSGSSQEAAVTPPAISHVQVASVLSLASQTEPLPVTGKVTSLSEATILAETSGEVVSLSHTIGDTVVAGAVIGEFENSSQQAAVLQAQGAYDAASAALMKETGTSATNSGITATQASQAAENAQVSAVAALQSAYAAMDDAVHTKADQLFTNPRTSTAALSITVPDSTLTNKVQRERVTLEATLTASQLLANSISTTTVDQNLSTMASNVQLVETFLTNLITAVNETPANANVSAATLAGYQSSLGAARTEAVGAYSSLTSAKSAYDSATLGATSAANSASGGTSNDIAAAQASVKEALGALNAAQANLEKTIIRSPISGVIVSLPITKGDYVSSFAQVAQVSNPGALYVDTEVTSDDAKTLAVGNKALINGTTEGVITFIAPALDPITSEIEVKVGITGDASTLTDGDTVTIALDRTQNNAAVTATNPNTPLVIPIVATKITPTSPIVFTIDATSSELVAHDITLGSILGDQVTVISGLTPDMNIVTDARGLTEGEVVVHTP